MKKLRVLAAGMILILAAAFLSGCGIVKIIPVGTEAEYTGHVEFDASAEASNDWEAIQQEVISGAVDLSAADVGSDPAAVTFTATVDEYNTDSPKTYLVVKAEGVNGEIQIPSGEKYSSSNTSIRDYQSIKTFGSFTNQTEWSEYAKTLNSESYNDVIAPLGDLEALVGSQIEVIGCAVKNGDVYEVTPVLIEMP